MDSAFKPLLDAVKYVMYEPGGIFFLVAATEDNQTAEQLTIAPPSSGKLYRAAENKAELLNLGLVGNSMLMRKISPTSEKWLVDKGWSKPQEPFNPHYAMVNRGDLSLDDLLELAVESWITAYGVTPNTPFGMHLALFQQEEIAAKYLTLDRETFLFTLPGYEPNVRFEPVPPKKPRKKVAKPAAAKKDTPVPDQKTTTKASTTLFGHFNVGDRVSFHIASGAQTLDVAGQLVGEQDGKARVKVSGHSVVPDNTYSLPWGQLVKL